MNSSKCCLLKHRCAADWMQMWPKVPEPLFLLAMRTDWGWAPSDPHHFCRVYFCPEVSRKAKFSAWMTVFPGGNENSWIYLLASLIANQGKNPSASTQFAPAEDPIPAKYLTPQKPMEIGPAYTKEGRACFMLSHGTLYCFYYPNNKKCPFINHLSFYNNKKGKK